MRKTLLLIFLIFFSKIVKAQINEGFSGYATISEVYLINGDTCNFKISSFNSINRPYGADSYTLTDFSIGDVVWSTDCHKFVISSFSENTGITAKGRMIRSDNNESFPINNTRVVLLREIITNNFTTYSLPPSGDGNGTTLIGISPATKACIDAHYRRQDSIPFSKIFKSQQCGLPNYLPKLNDPHTNRDTCAYMSYEFKRNDLKWYATSVIISAVTPQPTAINGSILISYERTEWFNTTNNVYYKWNGAAWESPNVSLANVVFTIGNQVIDGKKTFLDTVTTKAIVSNGVKTTGDATNAAAIMNGVVSEKDTIVSTNFTLTGAYGSVGWDCATGIKDCVLPPVANTVGWVFSIRKTDPSNNILRIKDDTGAIIYTLYNDISTIFQNNGTTWKRKQ